MIGLDTDVLVWPDVGIAEFGDEAAGLIDGQFVADGIAVSAISFLEIAVLIRRFRQSPVRSR